MMCVVDPTLDPRLVEYLVHRVNTTRLILQALVYDILWRKVPESGARSVHPAMTSPVFGTAAPVQVPAAGCIPFLADKSLVGRHGVRFCSRARAHVTEIGMDSDVIYMVNTHQHTHTQTSARARMHTHTYTHAYTHTHTHAHAHAHTHTHQEI